MVVRGRSCCVALPQRCAALAGSAADMTDLAVVADRLTRAADRLQHLDGHARPAPWTIERNGEYTDVDGPMGGWVARTDPDDPGDAELIAALRNAAPALVLALRTAAEETRVLVGDNKPGCMCYRCQTRNHLHVFACRLLREEDPT